MAIFCCPFRTLSLIVERCLFLFFYCSILFGGLFSSVLNGQITRCECFTQATPGGISLESERQLVSSGLQDSSEYSHRFLQCYRLDNSDSSSEFQLFQPFSQAFRGRSMRTNNNWRLRHPHIPQFSQSFGKV